MRLCNPALFVLICLAALPAQDWPQWRGPGRNGVAEGVKLPGEWPERLSRKWKVEVGEGHSSPLVVDGRIYQFARRGEMENLRAIEPDSGKILWVTGYAAPYEMNPAALGHGKGPKSTPVAHSGRIYTLGVSGILSCFDQQTGKQLWKKSFADRFRRTSPLYGAAMSPIVYKNSLIAHVGGHGGGAMISVDLESGKELWSWAEDGPGYTSPLIVELGGVTQLVTQSQDKNVGLSPEDGKLLWEMPFKTPYTQNIVTPVVREGLLIFSGLQSPTMALRLKNTGGKWDVEKVWENRDAYMYMSSPVVASGSLVGFSGRNSGQFFCQNLATGEITWRGRPRSGENASIIRAGENVLLLTDEAELAVAEVRNGSLAIVKTYSVADSPTWAHPAPIEGGLLVKDLDSLTRWEW